MLFGFRFERPLARAAEVVLARFLTVVWEILLLVELPGLSNIIGDSVLKNGRTIHFGGDRRKNAFSCKQSSATQRKATQKNANNRQQCATLRGPGRPVQQVPRISLIMSYVHGRVHQRVGQHHTAASLGLYRVTGPATLCLRFSRIGV